MKYLILLIGIISIFGCKDEIVQTTDIHDHTHLTVVTNGFPSMPIPENNPLTVEGVELGRKLFYDPILSIDSTQSCSSCHQQDHAFSDPKQFSIGVDGFPGNRNASAIVNAGWLTSAFWDGRSPSLENQAEGPVENPIEMHEDWGNAIQKLQNNINYPSYFYAAFSQTTITKELVTMAIAQFERTLISDKSNFDLSLKGNYNLTPLEAAGFNIFFTEKGECFHCHGQPLFTDNDFHNNGLDLVSNDIGYEDVTGKTSDRAKFRTPTLRNVEFSAPYMHDGRFNTLEEVIDFYSDSVKFSSTLDPVMSSDAESFNWTDLEKLQLLAFLKTLSDTSFINNTDYSNPWKPE
jgi:cytochrome c peroxidase